MTTTTVKRLTPGEMIVHFLEDFETTQYQLSRNTGIPHSRVTEIVKGRRGITADTALRLARAFGNSAEFWLSLQADHDLRKVRATKGAEIEEQAFPLKAS